MKLINLLLNNKKFKISFLVILDILIILFAYFLMFLFKFYSNEVHIREIVELYFINYKIIIISVLLYLLNFVLFRQYKSIWTLAGIDEVSRNILAVIVSLVFILGFNMFFGMHVSAMMIILSAIIIMILTTLIRINYRVVRRAIIFNSIKNNRDKMENVLIIGAGAGGVLVLNEIKSNIQLNKKVVGFIDDNNQKIGRFIRGTKVLGNRDDISRIVLEKNVSEIIIAIARVEDSKLKEIIQICKETGLPVKIIPSVSELIDNKFSIHSIRDVKVEDLLGRTVVKLEKEGINDYIRGNTILVTGGGGSIGSELCRQIAKFLPKEIIILDIYENNAYDIQNELIREFKNINIVTLIGSVRDKVRIEQIFKTYKPQIVFHAAAHKHVPLMEYSPSEAIKNNVGGTYNIAQYACKYNVKKFVLISTDKAVNPTNIMGATKRICEMIIQSMNSKSKTEFVAVRFGNVLGSNGSVVPLFKKQIENGGPVTLTHKDITRYFMTIPEAAQLVLQAGAYARGGEIFVLDMGEPVKIYDLAYNLIKLSGFEPNLDINIEITGLRPGEKLYEELLMSEEGLTETKHKKIFIGKPNDFDFDYISNKISELIELSIYGSVEEIKNKLKEIVPTYKEPHEVNKEVAATLLE